MHLEYPECSHRLRLEAAGPADVAGNPVGGGNVGAGTVIWVSDRRRSLVFFDDRYHEVYGAQENLLLLAELCRDHGHRCLMMTSADGELAQAARERGLDVSIVEAPPQLRTFERGTIRGGIGNRYRSLRAWVSYSAKLDTALHERQVDAVLAGSVRSTMHLSRLAMRRRGPKVLLFAQNSTPFGVFAALAALISDRILLIAPGAARTFPPGVLALLGRRVRALPSGRDIDRYHVARPLPDAESSTCEVVTVGSVTRRKGLDVLIEALGAVVASGRPCALTVVGGTSGSDSEQYRAEIVARADVLDVPLRLPGWQDDVVPFLESADVFALASYDEGLPGVLLEAMAAALPCVTTEAGGSGDLVRAAGCGLSVAVGDVQGLAGALTVLVDEPDTRLRLGAAGRAHAQEHHSLPAYLRRFEDVLADVVP